MINIRDPVDITRQHYLMFTKVIRQRPRLIPDCGHLYYSYLLDQIKTPLSLPDFSRWTPSWTWYPHWYKTNQTNQLMILTLRTLLRNRALWVVSSICSTLKILINSTLWVLSSILREPTSDFAHLSHVIYMLHTIVLLQYLLTIVGNHA